MTSTVHLSPTITLTSTQQPTQFAEHRILAPPESWYYESHESGDQPDNDGVNSINNSSTDECGGDNNINEDFGDEQLTENQLNELSWRISINSQKVDDDSDNIKARDETLMSCSRAFAAAGVCYETELMSVPEFMTSDNQLSFDPTNFQSAHQILENSSQILSSDCLPSQQYNLSNDFVVRNTYLKYPHQRRLSKLVGSTSPSPSWTEISSEVLPAAARELLSSTISRLYRTARWTYSQTKWTERYSDYGNNATGYYPQLEHPIESDKLYSSNDDEFYDHDLKWHSMCELPHFSSLPWVERQMVNEWRTYYPNEKRRDDNMDGLCAVDEDDADIDFDHARTLVPTPISKPIWKKADVCVLCHKTFGPTLLRHHCRLCGDSVCHTDSCQTRKLPHLGYHPDIPERVCDRCATVVWEQNLAERIAWRLARTRDSQTSDLIPYFEVGIDSIEQKVYRITQAAITMAKSIPLGAQATVAVETADVLRKYGLNGIYTIMLRQEFLAAADLLRKALGINQTRWPLSVHELSAAIFYALAQHRAMRGLYPDHEQHIHTIPIELASATEDTGKSNSDDVGNISTHGSYDDERKDSVNKLTCNRVPDSEISALLFYAPIALNFIYQEKEVDIQLLAAQQGWRLLYVYSNTELDGAASGTALWREVHDQPASALFVHDEQRIACLAIRGTTTIHDVITDIRQIPIPFPESDAKSVRPVEEGEEDWTNITFRGQGVAVVGMANAAFNLYREHIDALLILHRQGYRLRFTGHSLGGAVATLLGVLVYHELQAIESTSGKNPSTTNEYADERTAPLRVYSYGTPSCVDASLSDVVESFVITAVLHDDVVPRLSPATCRGLLKHLLHIRETWVKTQFPDDVKAFTDRAKSVWAPKWRGCFTLSKATTSSITLKRYCKTQLQKGKKKLLKVVKEKLSNENSGEFNKEDDCIYSTQYREFENGNRSFVVDANVKYDFNSDYVAQDNRPTIGDTALTSSLPCLVMDYMGGIAGRTGLEGMVIDGDEFFDPDGDVVDSSDDDNNTEASEEIYDEVTNEFQGQVMEHHEGVPHEKDVLQDGEDEPNVDMYASMVPDGIIEPTESEVDEDNLETVVLDEVPLPRMFIPGKIVHIYSHRGVYKAAFVPRAFRELRRISLAGNMLSDHKTKSYFDALLEVRSVRMAPENPPQWTAFDEDDTCSCCASPFTWASTSDSEAQEARDKHNCRSCGALVCHPCSERRIPLPSIGLISPVRVCDRCYYNDVNTGTVTDAFGSDTHGNVSDVSGLDTFDDKPTRQRVKRSIVVDDLASRVHITPIRS